MKTMLIVLALVIAGAAIPSEAQAKCRCNDDKKGKALSASAENS